MTTLAKTEIRFQTGIDTTTAVPKYASDNGLLSRLAVIQDTYRPDKDDLYFDEGLYLRLLEYAQQYAVANGVKIIEMTYERKGWRSGWRMGWSEIALSIDEFHRRWSVQPPEDRDPFPFILAEGDSGPPILCIATEFWVRIGGPREYHDTYTYSVYSRQDLGTEIREFLAASPDARHWDIQAVA